MIELQPLSEAGLAREALIRLTGEKSVLHRAGGVLMCVARSSVGLGEVLQDYAVQASQQLNALLQSAEHVVDGAAEAMDVDVMQQMHYTMKSIKAVLQMTPQAMERNKAEAIGGGAKSFTRADVTEIAHAFLNSPEAQRLLASEEATAPFVALAAKHAGVPVPGANRELATASH